MKEQSIIQTEKFVKSELNEVDSGHDWWHINRVRTMAMKLAKNYETDDLVVELAALLHDIADAKFHDGNQEIGERRSRLHLNQLSISHEQLEHITYIVRNVSFAGGTKTDKATSMEFKIVQDADRLDALGAIGIARAFNYGGYKDREIYNPDIKPVGYKTASDYYKSTAPTINHFYEKLFRLRDMMHTPEARKIATERHIFMENFLEQFFKEWNV